MAIGALVVKDIAVTVVVGIKIVIITGDALVRQWVAVIGVKRQETEIVIETEIESSVACLRQFCAHKQRMLKATKSSA